jgi:hypothetical protein
MPFQEVSAFALPVLFFTFFCCTCPSVDISFLTHTNIQRYKVK